MTMIKTSNFTKQWSLPKVFCSRDRPQPTTRSTGIMSIQSSIKRFIIRTYGSTRNFYVWLAAVIVTIYIIDNFIVTKERVHTYVKEMETANCGLAEKCPDGKYPYSIISGNRVNVTATFCFNGKYALPPPTKVDSMGFSFAVFKDPTKGDESKITMLTFIEEYSIQEYIKKIKSEDGLFFMASQGTGAIELSETSKYALTLFGSKTILDVKHAETFLMIGQKGLSQGAAIEERKSDLAANIQGCLRIPMAPLGTEPPPWPVQTGLLESNCGLKDACPADHLAVRLYTGITNKEHPKICANGRYVMTNGLNDAGRGFNIAVVDTKSGTVTKTGHYDTYETGRGLDDFLKQHTNPNEIVLAVVHDEGSRRITGLSKDKLRSLGSKYISELNFRGLMTFVGQAGIEGASPFEKFNAGPSNGHPDPIDEKLCIPFKLKGDPMAPAPPTNTGEMRKNFCIKHGTTYPDVCKAGEVDKQLTAAALTDKAYENHAIFMVPIVVVPGKNHGTFGTLLLSLLTQPGLKPGMVLVAYDKAEYPEAGELAEVFGFKATELAPSIHYGEKIKQALEQTWKTFPFSKHFILLEEELILEPDFITFMAQLFPIIDTDDSLIGISAWNDNSYKGLSTGKDIVHRVEMFPGLGSLIKRSYYDSYMKDKMAQCCYRRAWDGWTRPEGKEMLVPDISRVARRKLEGLPREAEYLQELINKDRVTLKEANIKFVNTGELPKDKYETSIDSAISKQQVPLDTGGIKDCFKKKGLGFKIPDEKGKTYTIYFEQSRSDDHYVLHHLCACFHLFHVKGFASKGVHNNMLRFTYKENMIYLIGSASPYAKHMPKDYKILKKDQVPKL